MNEQPKAIKEAIEKLSQYAVYDEWQGVTLMFDKHNPPPTLIYVLPAGSRSPIIYEKGRRVDNLTSVKIEAAINEVPTHSYTKHTL
jgi:hypothetical protein